MAKWYHRLDGHEFKKALGVGDGEGSLACYSPWGREESDTTEQLNWTEPALNSPTRDQIWTHVLKAPNPNHWTTREFPCDFWPLWCVAFFHQGKWAFLQEKQLYFSWWGDTMKAILTPAQLNNPRVLDVSRQCFPQGNQKITKGINMPIFSRLPLGI